MKDILENKFDYDIETAVEERSFEKAQSYIESSVKDLRELLRRQEYKKLEAKISYEQRINEWIQKKYESSENIDFSVGYYFGLLSSFREALNQHYKSERTRDILNNFEAFELPHLNEVLFVIESIEGIRHGQLADKLGLDKSTLTGIMEKIIASGAVTFSRPGKFKYYYLTQLGRDYCNKHREQFRLSRNLDVVLEELLEIVERNDNSPEIVGRIFKTIYERKTTYLSYPSTRERSQDILHEIVKSIKIKIPREPSNICYDVEAAYTVWDSSSLLPQILLKASKAVPKSNNAKVV